ncbi:hypothetical protein J3E69DRAFT_343144 [Trichoderma sp. SZMC 28015]
MGRIGRGRLGERGKLVVQQFSLVAAATVQVSSGTWLQRAVQQQGPLTGPFQGLLWTRRSGLSGFAGCTGGFQLASSGARPC